jgi:catechol 2,3-dioxygenase-like lactoylglutathione lyase family enzyme
MVPSGPVGLAASVDFYTRHMGFAVEWQTDSMAGIRRGDVAMHLVENRSVEWAENASFSIGVDDLDALYAEYRDMPANVGPLEMKSWGRREFHLIVPGMVCFQFYQADAG